MCGNCGGNYLLPVFRKVESIGKYFHISTEYSGMFRSSLQIIFQVNVCIRFFPFNNSQGNILQICLVILYTSCAVYIHLLHMRWSDKAGSWMFYIAVFQTIYTNVSVIFHQEDLFTLLGWSFDESIRRITYSSNSPQ